MSEIETVESMNPFSFWLPRDGNAIEIPISAEYVEKVMVPAAEHEAGHIVVAHHFKARVLGIAAGFLPDKQTMFLQALYSWRTRPSVESQCVVKAAGPAADMLFTGSIDEKATSEDLKDIPEMKGIESFDPFLEKAKKILADHSNEFACIANALRRTLEIGEDRMLGLLPDKHVGSLLLNEEQLMECLAQK